MLNPSSPVSSPVDSAHRGVFKDIRRLLDKQKNPQDAFRVKFAARSSFVARLGLTRQSANVNLELLDSSQAKVIAASRRLAGRPERIQIENLEPGTYYVRAVLARGKRSRYRLQVNTAPLADTGDSPSSARFLDVTSLPISMQEFVGAEDQSDFYTFQVGGSGFPTAQLNLKLAGLNGDFLEGNVRVLIRDRSLQVVKEQATNNRLGFTWDESLADGTYFVQVEPKTATDRANYRLTLSANAISDSAGNTPNAAREVSLTAADSLFQDFVGTGDRQDYYKFTVPQSDFRLRLTGPNGNLLTGSITVRLRDQINTVLEEKITSGGVGLAIDKPLEAGTYIAQISSSDDVNYALLMAAEPT